MPTPNSPQIPKFSWKIFLITLVILLAVFGAYSYSQIEEVDKNVQETSLSEVITKSKNGDVTKIDAYDQDLVATLKDQTKIRSRRESFSNLVDLGIDPSKTEIVIHDTSKGQLFFSLAGNILPFILIFGLLWLFMRKMGGGGILGGLTGGMKEDGENAQKSQINFKDVAGVEEPKQELIEVVDFLKSPRKYQLMGAKIPRGVLLVGPPGTGKTLLAKAVAGEAGVPFFHISGSEFEEMFVGVGASRARTLFAKAKQTAPSIIFIDELDAIGKSRAQTPVGHSASDQTLNQILVEMDGFGPRENVIVLAATNRPDILDPALLRPGRFDRRIVLDMPTLSERHEILRVHGRGKKLNPKLNLKRIADMTAGFSGADLANLLNEAAIATVKNKKPFISEREIDMALEKIVLGLENKSCVLSEEEKKITAYHEAGHALVAFQMPAGKKIRKISIMSRGHSLGSTWTVSEEDRHLHSIDDFESELAHLLGGRAAEEQAFKKITTGATNDLERATKIARAMVAEYGMSSLGITSYSDQEVNPYLRGLSSARPFSEETAAKIDKEVTKIINHAYNIASKVLRKEKKKLDSLAKELLQKEMLTEEDIQRILGQGRKAIKM